MTPQGDHSAAWLRASRLLRLTALLLLSLAAFSLVCSDDVRNVFIDDALFQKEIKNAAEKYHLDPDLVRAVIFKESRFDPFCKGRKGELGLMQILPAGAAADYCRIKKLPPYPENALYDPALNVEIGCWYLARAEQRWKGYALHDALALAQYNAGAGRAVKWAPEDPLENDLDAFLKRVSISTTRNYVKAILRRYERYRRERQHEELP